VDELKRKFQSFRAAVSRELGKIAASKTNGSGADDINTTVIR
jgi:hypothetical protein